MIVAPPGSSEAIRDVLTDLSAAGLVRDFYWLSDADAASVTGSTQVLRISDGVPQAQRLADVLAGATPVEHVTLCVLVTTVPGDQATSTATELAVSAYLDGHRRQAADFTRLRVLIVRAGAALPEGGVAAFEGWHNIVIAPEDAHGPALGHESLGTEDPVEVARNAAPVLVALCGLWSSVDHHPLDSMLPLPGNTLRVARSFYRQLDGSSVAERLRTKLFDVRGKFPLPYDQSNPVIYVSDVAQETHRMAEQLWAKHRDLLMGPRKRPPPESGRTLIGWRILLRMFLAFLWAALRNVPNSWQQRFADERAVATARMIENVVLGKTSSYQVVVNGKTADGRSVRWTAYAPAARQLANALDGADADAMAPIANTDLSVVWRDYASAAFTLCDAQERSSLLPPAQIGINRAVVDTAAEVIHAPGAGFTVTPTSLAERVGVDWVAPSDIAGIDELAERLHTIATDRSAGTEARAAAAGFASWRARLGRSYGYAFGQRITDELERTLAEVRALLARIEAMAQGSEPKTAAARQRRLILLAQGALLLYLLVFAAVVVGVVTGRLGVVAVVEIASAATAVLAVVLLVVFVLAERALFRLLHRSRQAADTMDIDKLNLRTALRDVERLSQAVTQYQSWSQVLGAFLDDPLGFTGAADTPPVRIRWGLPRNTAVGAARADENQVDEVAADLRAGLFRVGWLSAPWEQIVTTVGEQLGPTARDIRLTPELIFSRPGLGSGSALDAWAQQLSATGVPATGSSTMWRDVLATLDSDTARDRMVKDVECFENGVAQQVSVDHFRAGIGDPVAAADGRFDTAVFTDSAVASWKTEVVHDSPVAFVGKDLGWIALTTQFSDGVAFDDLNLLGEEGTSPHPQSSEPTTIF